MAGPQLTPLHELHAAHGAKLTEFADWLMPLRYASELAEHTAVRTAAGIFDVSHMAEFAVNGSTAGNFLDFALAGSLTALAVGRAKYTMVLAEDGGVIDDLMVYRVDADSYLVVANAANRESVRTALRDRAAGYSVTIRDETESCSLLAIQGPASAAIVESVLPGDQTMAGMRNASCARMTVAGIPVLAARTGYTGEDGFELFVDAGRAPELWTSLLAAGAPFGLRPCGLAARDTLRLEAGMPLYGHELSRAVQPVQAGLGRVVPQTKTTDFVGRAAICAGPPPGARILVGLEAEGRRAAREGYPVLAGTVHVGTVTSGALSPTLGHPIAMAYVDQGASGVGTELTVDVRGTALPVRVVSLPFYTRKQ